MNTLLSSLILILDLFLGPVIGEKDLKLLGLLPMTGQGWVGGAACTVPTQLAIDDVNARDDILRGYNLSYEYVDSQCSQGIGAYRMVKALDNNPTYHMVLGCGCSTVSESTSQISYLWNLTQLSFGSSSPILSDRTRFPKFFRMGVPDQKHVNARLDLMRKYNWKKVATIHQALEFFSVVMDDFVQHVRDSEDISIISQEIFVDDPLTRIQNLKVIGSRGKCVLNTSFGVTKKQDKIWVNHGCRAVFQVLTCTKHKLQTCVSRRSKIAVCTIDKDPKDHDARIIVTAMYEDRARAVLCAAYKVGLYGPKVVWVFSGWYSTEFWNVGDTDCTREQLAVVVEGAFLTSAISRNVMDSRGVANLSPPELIERVHAHPAYNPESKPFEFVIFQCYDHIWLSALALNCTVAKLEEAGHVKRLDEFTYADGDILEMVFHCMQDSNLDGLSGRVSFKTGGDPDKIMNLQRVQGGKRIRVGLYRQDLDPPFYEWEDGAIQWKEGVIPRDSTYIQFEEITLPTSLYISMCIAAGLGIVLAILFFSFNIYDRHNRIVKLSSPNINNTLLLGCVICYGTIFIMSAETSRHGICKARVIFFTMGFTLTFGSLFSKTWRVYKIFTNKKLLRMSIKDYQLLAIMGVVLGVVLSVIVIWEGVAPHEVIVQQLEKEVYMIGNDAVVRPYVRVCHSEYSVHFGWTIYIIEGAMLSFGAFLAWETRNVKIQAMNDSRQIGICLYNVVVLSAVGLTLSLLLDQQVVMLYGITSGCLIIGTTATQLLVFIPKVHAVYNGVDALGTEFGTSIPPTTTTGVTASCHTKATDDTSNVQDNE